MNYNKYIIVALLVLATNTAQAAMLTIDLDSACASADSPCMIPESGLILHEFITLSSPDNALIVNPTPASGNPDPQPEDMDARVALLAESPPSTPKTAIFEFDESRALVTEISFAGSGANNGLTYTVFETESDSTSQTGFNDFPALITGYDSIIRLELSALEGSAGAFNIIYTPVPLPAAAWLFGAGLVGLGGVSTRRHRS